MKRILLVSAVLMFTPFVLVACGNPDLPPPSLLDDVPAEQLPGILEEIDSDNIGLPGATFPEELRSEGTGGFDQDDDDSESTDRPQNFDQDDDNSEVVDRPQNFDQDDDDSETADRPQNFDQDDDDSESADRPQNFDQDDDDSELLDRSDLEARIRELEEEIARLNAALEDCQKTSCDVSGFEAVDPGSIEVDADGTATFEGFSAAPKATSPSIEPTISVRGGLF